VRRGILAVGAFGAITTTVLVVGASAAGGWTSDPAGALAGAPVRITAAADEPCVWDVTRADGGAVTRYDGVRVEIGLAGQHIGAVPVADGGAWRGTLRVPAIAAGTYPLTARCIVTDPALPGGQAFDFPVRSFSVAEAPPPTSVTTAPPAVIAPVTVVTAPPAPQSTPDPSPPTPARTARATLPDTGPTAAALPNTGDGTLAVALAGLGALGIGAGAVWWGGRKRPVPTDGSS
jgi:LPXTG-motif cell wall-anchored protein